MNYGESIEANSSHTPNRLHAFAGLLHGASALIAELELSKAASDSETNKCADQAEATFTFEIIGENEIMIPEKVRGIMPDLDQITVTIGKADADSSSYLSINFVSANKTIVISRSGLDELDDTPDAVIDTSLQQRTDYMPDGTPYSSLSANHQMQNESPTDFAQRQTDIEKIPRAELNALIMSLLYPNPDRLYAQFDGVDFLAPATHDSLRNSFELAAFHNQDSVTYHFTTTETVFNFMNQEGHPVSFQISYLDSKSKQRIDVQSNLDTDFKIEFSTRDTLENNPYFNSENELVRKPYYPTTDELYHLLSILKDEIAAIKPTMLTTSNLEILNNAHPERLVVEEGTNIFSAVYTRNVLDQLGFDSPDSGTA